MLTRSNRARETIALIMNGKPILPWKFFHKEWMPANERCWVEPEITLQIGYSVPGNLSAIHGHYICRSVSTVYRQEEFQDSEGSRHRSDCLSKLPFESRCTSTGGNESLS